MRVQQPKSVSDKANFSALRNLPKITVPKLTADNYDILTTYLCYVVGTTIVMNVIPINRFMCGVTGNYNSPWTNWEDNLNNCLLHTSESLNNGCITLYSLYYQYIGTEGVSSNIINKYYSTNNGCKCHQDFELHFRNYSYLTNKATADTSTMNSSVYKW